MKFIYKTFSQTSFLSNTIANLNICHFKNPFNFQYSLLDQSDRLPISLTRYRIYFQSRKNVMHLIKYKVMQQEIIPGITFYKKITVDSISNPQSLNEYVTQRRRWILLQNYISKAFKLFHNSCSFNPGYFMGMIPSSVLSCNLLFSRHQHNKFQFKLFQKEKNIYPLVFLTLY